MPLQGRVRWQDLLISRITNDVKLVGPTISCEGSPKEGNVNGEWRTNPHVQSYVVATDRVRPQPDSCRQNLWQICIPLLARANPLLARETES